MLMKTTGKMPLHSTGKAINGRWTREEHELFLEALNEYGREWKKVAKKIKTRSSAQIRSHAQKYFQKLSKESKAGLHGGAAAIHGSHVVLEKNTTKKKKLSSAGDKTLIKKKRKLKGKKPTVACKKTKRAISPDQVFKPVHAYGGRFSPVQKARASPRNMDTSLSSNRTFGSAANLSPSTQPSPSFKSPFVTRTFVQTIATKKKLVQSWEQRLRTLLSKRKKVSGFVKGNVATKVAREQQQQEAAAGGSHDDLVATPRLSPLNIQQNGRDVSRVRERLNRRNDLIEVDTKIIDVIDSACHAPCICGEPKLIFHCRNQQEKELGDGNSYICISVRQKMLNIFQRSYEKNGAFSTPHSAALLEKWKKINLEIASAKAAELSYQNAEMLYMALSPVARENLSIFDDEELSAVQVLIGSMMGIRPRKSKGTSWRKKEANTKATKKTTKPRRNKAVKQEEEDSESDKSESDKSESESEDGDDSSTDESDQSESESDGSESDEE